MEKVYIVTEGEYSDYHIVCAFSTRKKADEFVQNKGSEYRIETFDLDTKEIDKGEKVWQVVFLIEDGSTKSFSAEVTKQKENLSDLIQWCNSFSEDRIFLWVKADTMDRAVKIANERKNAILSSPWKYPYLRIECVREKIFSYIWKYNPLYDFFTGEIVLRGGEYLMDGCSAKTRMIL